MIESSVSRTFVLYGAFAVALLTAFVAAHSDAADQFCHDGPIAWQNGTVLGCHDGGGIGLGQASFAGSDSATVFTFGGLRCAVQGFDSRGRATGLIIFNENENATVKCFKEDNGLCVAVSMADLNCFLP